MNNLFEIIFKNPFPPVKIAIFTITFIIYLSMAIIFFLLCKKDKDKSKMGYVYFFLILLIGHFLYLLYPNVIKSKSIIGLLYLIMINIAFLSIFIWNLKIKTGKIKYTIINLINSLAVGIFIGALITHFIVKKPLPMKYSGKYSYDLNKDGKIDYVRFYKEGFKTKEEFDRNYNNIFEEKKYYSNNIIVKIEKDTNEDGKIDWFLLYKNGKLSSGKSDLDYDGTIDKWIKYKNYLPVEEEYDINNDSKIDIKITYKNGVRRKKFVDKNNDGKFETIINYNKYGIEEK